MALLSLPSEVLIHAIQYLDKFKDINALCRTNRLLYQLSNQHLYHLSAVRGGFALNWAIRAGRTATVKIYLAHDNVPRKPRFYNRPVFLAAASRHIEVIELLAHRASNLNARISRWTAMTYAADKGYEDVVRLLLDKDADPLVGNNKYWPDKGRPLWHAICNGHEAISKLLIDRGVKLDYPESNAWTPVSEAARRGQISIVKLLVEKIGIDGHANDRRGIQALFWAARAGHRAIVEFFLDIGFDANCREMMGSTLLEDATWSGDEDTVQFLVSRGADVHGSVDRWHTPLHRAAVLKYPALVKLFLDEGVDVNIKNESGKTPLMLAYDSSPNASALARREVIELLIQHGGKDPRHPS